MAARGILLWQASVSVVFQTRLPLPLITGQRWSGVLSDEWPRPSMRMSSRSSAGKTQT